MGFSANMDTPGQQPRGLPATLEWVGGEDGGLRILDQTLLPGRVEMRVCRSAEEVWEAIRVMRVRGAPAIGVAAAFGLCLGTRPFRDAEPDAFRAKVREVGDYLCSARPTAVNLSWAVERIYGVTEQGFSGDTPKMWGAMLAEAQVVAREDAEVCRRIGQVGAPLVPDGGAVLTHCNAGALATVAYGTALSMLYVAHEQGKRFRVFAGETRPLLQGARLTAFELVAAGIDVTVVCDSVAASLMQAGRVQMVAVGADRIAANGDVANKIGTYSLAVAAKHHGIPFYVAAPLSTFDLTLASGDGIPIEQRPAEEIRSVCGRPVVAPGAGCYNPAFDVTPAALITALITEKGRLKPVTAKKIRDFF